MDANALLAIYTKVQQIYNTGDSKFICFPLDFQFIFSPESLSLLFEEDAANAASFLNQRADFSRVMNRPVKGPFLSSDAGDLLWDVYHDILMTAEIAETPLSPEEKKAFQKAEDFLFDKDENGWTVPSEKYKQYSEFRDRSFAYDEQIANIKASESLSEEGRRIELAKLIKAQAENDELWSAGGLRQEVEKHLNFREKILANSPMTAWAKMKDKCQPDLSVQTDLTGSSFATTYLFPINVLGQPWCTINVGKEEANALLKQASPEVKKRLSSDYSDPIESFSFEYRSVGVQRPWFDSNLFKSKLWRFPLSSGQQISYGSEKLLGRFPAYISALLLLRNFHISYASGKEINSFGALASNQTGSDQDVSVLAYICKRIPISPNPDASVKWPTTRKTAPLHLQQKAGGTLHAYIGGEEVDSGAFAIGETVRIRAVADSNCFLSKWKINDETVENKDYTYECTLGENGLSITPYWEYGETLDSSHVVVRKDTLVSLDKGPAVLDMNRQSALSQVKVIGAKAFKNYSNLSNITIGKSVEIIGEQVFPNCSLLEEVFIPGNTRSIHKSAFVRDNFQEEPFIHIDPAHETYTSLNGVLLEKSQLLPVQAINCRCGAKYVFSGEKPTICPNCGNELDPSLVQDVTIRRPDARAPFRVVSEQEARNLIQESLAKMPLVDKEFKALMSRSDLPLKPVYIPLWEWCAQTKAKDDGEAQKNPIPDSMIAVPASRVISNDVMDTGHIYTEKFSFDQVPPSTAFEFYSQSIRECQKNNRQKILKTLTERSKASTEAAASETNNYISEVNRLIYNPFWVGSVEHKGETYRFRVDGYSKKVSFEKAIPRGWEKWALISGSILAAIALIVLVVCLTRKHVDDVAPSVDYNKPTVIDESSDGFTLHWERATDNVTTIDSINYFVYLKDDSKDAEWQLVHNAQGISSYTFTDLKVGVNYAYSVVAQDEAGNVFRYEPGEIAVKDQEPPTVENRGLTIRALSHNSITISWSKATDNVTAEDKILYQIFLMSLGGADQDYQFIKELKGGTSYVISDLQPNQVYSCVVKAKDESDNVCIFEALQFETANAPTETNPSGLQTIDRLRATEYVVTLTQIGQAKLAVIKAIKESAGLGLKEAKDLIDSELPITIKKTLSKSDAETIKAALENAGATVEIKSSRLDLRRMKLATKALPVKSGE